MDYIAYSVGIFISLVALPPLLTLADVSGLKSPGFIAGLVALYLMGLGIVYAIKFMARSFRRQIDARVAEKEKAKTTAEPNVFHDGDTRQQNISGTLPPIKTEGEDDNSKPA